MTTEEDNLIRTWARKQGISIGTRGRIAKEIKTAYYNCTSGEPAEEQRALDDVPSKRKSKTRTMCGWCETHQHERCIRTIRQGSNVVPPVWVCYCFEVNKAHHPDIVA